MSYAALSCLGVLAAVALDLVVLGTRLLVRKVFWTAYAIVLFFQVLTNGVLSARGIVHYDEDAIFGPRFGYAPVEDLLFGFSLVLQTLSWWVWWGRRGLGQDPGAGEAGAGEPSATAAPRARRARR